MPVVTEADTGDPAGPDAAQLARAVAEVHDAVCTHLDRLAEEVIAAVREAGQRRLTEGDLDEFRDDVLATMPGLRHVIGMGFAAAPDVIADQPRCLLWWQRRGDHMHRLRLNLDPRAVDVYDYQEMDWYRLARDEQRRVAIGPYVDYSGSDQVTVTISVPVVVDGRFLGITGADLSLAEMEHWWLVVLLGSKVDAVLLNSERRVVASNSIRWVVSDKLLRMPEPGHDGIIDVAEIPDGTRWRVARAKFAEPRA